MSTPPPPPVTGKRLYRFGEVVGGFLRGLDRAQEISDQYSLELANLYAAPGNALDAFSVPNAALRTVDIDLKCAVAGLARPRAAGVALDAASTGGAAADASATDDGERVTVVDLGDGTPLPNVDVIVDAYTLRELPPDVLCTVRLHIEVGTFPVNEIFAEESGPSLAVDASRTSFTTEGESAMLIATVSDASGNPLADQQVRLAQRPEGWFELPAVPLLTNVDGKASARVALLVTPAESTLVELLLATTVVTGGGPVALERRLLLTAAPPFPAGAG